MDKIQARIEDFSFYFQEHGFITKIVAALLLAVIGFFVIIIISKLLRKILEKRHFDQTLLPFMVNLFRWSLFILLFIIVAAIVGIETTSFVALIGAIGFAIGMAFQGALGNLAGGALILIFRPYKIGDLIKTQGHRGVVKEIQLFTTILITADNQTIIIPNGAISSSDIVNYNVEGVRRVDLVVGVSYKADLKKAKEVLMEVMLEDENVLKNPAPFVGVLELADSSVNLAVRPYATPEKYWDVYFNIYEKAKLALDKEGVEIPFPQMDVHISKENA